MGEKRQTMPNNLYRYFALKEEKQNTQRPPSKEDSMEGRRKASNYTVQKPDECYFSPLINTNSLKSSSQYVPIIWYDNGNLHQTNCNTGKFYNTPDQDSWELLVIKNKGSLRKHHSQQGPNETITTKCNRRSWNKRILGKTKKTWIKYRF